MNWEEMVISAMYNMRVSPLIFQDENLIVPMPITNIDSFRIGTVRVQGVCERLKSI